MGPKRLPCSPAWLIPPTLPALCADLPGLARLKSGASCVLRSHRVTVAHRAFEGPRVRCPPRWAAASPCLCSTDDKAPSLRFSPTHPNNSLVAATRAASSSPSLTPRLSKGAACVGGGSTACSPRPTTWFSEARPFLAIADPAAAWPQPVSADPRPSHDRRRFVSKAPLSSLLSPSSAPPARPVCDAALRGRPQTPR